MADFRILSLNSFFKCLSLSLILGGTGHKLMAQIVAGEASDQGENVASLHDHYLSIFRNGSENEFLDALFSLQLDYTENGHQLRHIRIDPNIQKAILERTTKIAQEHNFPKSFFMGSIDTTEKKNWPDNGVKWMDSNVLLDLRSADSRNSELNFTNFYNALVARRLQDARSAKEWLEAASTPLPFGRSEWEGIRGAAIEAHEMRFYELNPTTEDMKEFTNKYRRGGYQSKPIYPYFGKLREAFLNANPDLQKAWVPNEDLISFSHKLMNKSDTEEALRIEAIKFCLAHGNDKLEKIAILNLWHFDQDTRVKYLSELTDNNRKWSFYTVGRHPNEVLSVIDFTKPNTHVIASSISRQSLIKEWEDFSKSKTDPNSNIVALFDKMASHHDSQRAYDTIPPQLAKHEMKIRNSSGLAFQFHEAMKNWMQSEVENVEDFNNRIKTLLHDYIDPSAQFREAELYSVLNDGFKRSALERFVKNKDKKNPVSSALVKKILQYERNPLSLEPSLSLMINAYTNQPARFTDNRRLGLWEDLTETLANKNLREHLLRKFPDLFAFQGKGSLLQASRTNLQAHSRLQGPRVEASSAQAYKKLEEQIAQFRNQPQIDIWGPTSQEARQAVFKQETRKISSKGRRFLHALLSFCSLGRNYE